MVRKSGWIVVLGALILGCGMDRYIFTLKAVTLSAFQNDGYPAQNLRIKICDPDNPDNVLATTEPYPSSMTLPATFEVNPTLDFHLYKQSIAVQLWGDSTGAIATSIVDMDEYKIIFPIEMETTSGVARFTLHGSWE